MDEQPQIVKENSVPEQSHNVALQNDSKSSLKKKLDTIFTIFFSVCIFLAVFAGIYYLGTGKSILPQFPTAAKPTGAMPTKESFEVTQKTQIAKSLTPLSLNPKLHWSLEHTNSSATEKFADISADKYNDKVVSIPFTKGKTYISNNLQSRKNDDPLQSFISQAEQEGWIYFNDSNVYLNFKSFRLQSELADSPCGGIDTFAGYKDGEVSMIALSHTINPCEPAGFKQNGNINEKTTYTVFISEPTPINYFVDYLSKNLNK